MANPHFNDKSIKFIKPASNSHKRGNSLKVDVNENSQTVPKVFNHLMEKPETISDMDYLKEDIYSSPKFMYDPTVATQKMQMRFLDQEGKKPIKRSHCGNINDYLAF